MLSSLIFIPIYLYIIFKNIKFKFNYFMLKESLLFSLPLIPSLLSAWVINLSDRIFIERFFSMSDVGIYSLGYKLGGIVLIISAAFQKAYSPLF
ncbi:MAG: oligosaccharide flippase family protein [Halanaerobiales bacterium]|nr:oligosaccharide flippase family protein [Halanaerobiales bacterium]